MNGMTELLEGLKDKSKKQREKLAQWEKNIGELESERNDLSI